MSFDYKELLKKAREQLPEVKPLAKERLKIPDPQVMFEGRKTVLLNFKEIVEVLNRDPNHFLKFLSKELATAPTVEQTRIVFQGKHSFVTLKNLLERYVAEFVKCKVCSRLDTRLIREDRITFLRCDACGAKYAVKSIR